LPELKNWFWVENAAFEFQPAEKKAFSSVVIRSNILQGKNGLSHSNAIQLKNNQIYIYICITMHDQLMQK